MGPSAFEPVRFLFRWRAAMTLELAELAERPVLREGFRIGPWEPSLLDRVADVDYRAYYGTVDGALFGRYFCSPRGCRRMWEEAFHGRFGAFDPVRTRVLYRGDRVCGDVLCCNRSPDEGFIANLAVLPEDRGGTGRALLLSALWAYRETGFQRVSLAVTLKNVRAYHLYREIGFRRRYRFPVIAWSGRPGPVPQSEGAAVRGCPPM